MKIDADSIQDFPEKTPPNEFDSARVLSNRALDVSLRTDYAYLIEQVIQAPDTDAVAIRRAHELLLSGQLEDPENLRAAAESIATFGV